MRLRDLAGNLEGTVSSHGLSRVTKVALSALPEKTYLANDTVYPITSYSLHCGPELVWRLMTLTGTRKRSFSVFGSHAAFFRHLQMSPEKLRCRSCTAYFTDEADLRICDVCGLFNHDDGKCNMHVPLSTHPVEGTILETCTPCYEWAIFANQIFYNGRLPFEHVKAINLANIESLCSGGASIRIHSGNIKEALEQLRADNRI